MSAMATQIPCLTIVHSTVYLGTDQRKHQSSASLAFAQGINQWPVNSPHKWPVTRKMFPFDDVIVSSRGRNPATEIYGYPIFNFVAIRFISDELISSYGLYMIDG